MSKIYTNLQTKYFLDKDLLTNLKKLMQIINHAQIQFKIV